MTRSLLFDCANMTEETVAWSDAKDAVRAAVGFHEKQKARKSVTMVGASEGKAPERLSKAAAATRNLTPRVCPPFAPPARFGR